ncbi:MAG: pseudouridine synthase [Planctomycetota bacterium]
MSPPHNRPPHPPRDSGPRHPGSGNHGSGNRGPGNQGPGGRGPGNRGPANRSQGNSGPGNRGPGNRGPRSFGPGNSGPRNFGPRNFGPRSSGPGDRGPRSSGPRWNASNRPSPGGPRNHRDGGRPDKYRGTDARRGQRAPTTFNTVYEDDEIIVVEKPIGMISATPTPTGRTTLFDLIKDHVRQRHGRRARTWVIHRLDMEATGLLVFAKSPNAFRFLKADLQARRVRRVYVALCSGAFDAGEGSDGLVRTFLRERKDGSVESIDDGGMTRPPDPKDPFGPKLATTHYRVEKQDEQKALVKIRLESGRKHQIRVHMASTGHPIVGDLKYGNGNNPLRRLCLHASELAFTHPTTGESVRFLSPPPPEFFEAFGEDAPEPERAEMPRTVARSPREHERREAANDGPTDADDGSESGWDHVADWYDESHAEARSDHFAEVILPGTMRLLGLREGDRLVDIACGEGTLCRRLSEQGVRCLGVDASPGLVDAARARGGGPRYEVADARDLAPIAELMGETRATAASCVMAAMNIDPLRPLLEGAANLLEPGAPLVLVMLHPAFRAPKQTAWGWSAQKAHRGTQYRRVDAYLSTNAHEIVMNPGEVSSGEEAVVTTTHHRPLQAYVEALAEAGFLIEKLEEWPSLRRSQPGPRADEENRARREIPMFLGVRAVLRMDAGATS